jgi:hypothetical protein
MTRCVPDRLLWDLSRHDSWTQFQEQADGTLKLCRAGRSNGSSQLRLTDRQEALAVAQQIERALTALGSMTRLPLRCGSQLYVRRGGGASGRYPIRIWVAGKGPRGGRQIWMALDTQDARLLADALRTWAS